jgi:hypothetical protein
MGGCGEYNQATKLLNLYNKINLNLILKLWRKFKIPEAKSF